MLALYLIEILHQTTTLRRLIFRPKKLYLIEILHQTTTVVGMPCSVRKLYLIEILHQTTTNSVYGIVDALLYLIEILHQTTTSGGFLPSQRCCILSKFYIKPQPCLTKNFIEKVVSYRNSTSNHNSFSVKSMTMGVVSYRNSTSNHNAGTATPNSALLYLIEILHQTTTQRHT